ncbi:hypothetical protein [Phenylobacterium sp.]|uniref:hypothetical protein n=1 Tax=Phenylobacterium sp. TaxID=1871053 RepID=UPI00286C81F9|nr:hypothetical protein [Phenylobacterium sp.]
MGALSERKIEIVRTLVETAPDRIVGNLQLALAQSGDDTVLADVRLLVEAEARDRALRNAVFAPLAPLCVGDGSDGHSLVFPARALALVWRGLKREAAAEVAAAAVIAESVAAAVADERQPPDPSLAFDALVRAAADVLRAGQARDFRTAAEICEAARAGGAAALASCLAISPVVRCAIGRLPDWIGRVDDETAAAARLAYKDAVAIAEDAGPRFFEMLAAQLTPRWMVLRIISAIMDRPTERYLAESELGAFPERVMSDIDAALTAIATLDPDAGPSVATQVAARIGVVTAQTYELEGAIELTRDQGWGRRIVDQKQALAKVVEARLREAEAFATAALPSEVAGLARLRKKGPKLDTAPDPRAVARAMTLLAFSETARPFANYGGFSAAHTRLVDRLGGMIDHYVEDVLDLARTGDLPDRGIAHAYLSVAADFAGLVRDEKFAELIRRRAAVCHGGDPT